MMARGRIMTIYIQQSLVLIPTATGIAGVRRTEHQLMKMETWEGVRIE
jgi:hypothetical protein